MPLKDMALTEEERKEQGHGPGTLIADLPKYPHGLKLHIDEKSFEKLDVQGNVQVGQSIMILARVEVSQLSQEKTRDEKPNRRMVLQITDMAIEGEKKEQTEEYVNNVFHSKES